MKSPDAWNNLISKYGSVDDLLSAVVTNFKEQYKSSARTASSEIHLSDDNWCVEFSTDVITKQLKKLSPHKGSGIDGIPNRVYAALAESIAEPLKVIFNASVLQRKFPMAWKTGIVTPIPKTSPTKITELRPVTVLPAPAKILEKIIVHEMKSA